MKIKPNIYYHLYNRGNNKNLIFFEEENYIYFLAQFKKYVAPFCNVHSYCLMPNHFHFFISLNDELLFEKGMKNFFISYSKAINKRYNRVGSLFQGRYKASEIDSNSYYTAIVMYIHQNPVLANMVEEMEDYKYSSYASYLSNKQTGLNKQEVIDWFGGLDSFIEHHKLMRKEAEINRYLKL